MAGSIVSKEDVMESFVRSGGPGGQNVNKVETCVVLIHQPTGIMVKCQKHRRQFLNRQEAWKLLRQAVAAKDEREQRDRRHQAEKKRRQGRGRSKSAQERILEYKKKHSLKKQNRKGVLRDA